MKVLFTGGSSFTGYWFVRRLLAAGHEVTATMTQASAGDYQAVRGRRVAELAQAGCGLEFGCRFGDERFESVVAASSRWDALCHHGADVTDYKSADFDVTRAVANNTRRLAEVLEGLSSRGCERVVLTGSVFECDEGAGSQGLGAFSPYGLSKALAAQMFRYYCDRSGVALGKFVIPNPFGPLEQPRFTAYLMKTWYAGQTPAVRTPDYVRDNIHVSLLARAYVRFVERIGGGGGMVKFNPSGYVESQGAFAERFGRAMGRRLELRCPVTLQKQTEFTEPMVRINTDVLDHDDLGWDEAAAWDQVAAFYQQQFAQQTSVV